MLSAKAPGKLILSGEHSVVYGAPAIAVAVTNTVTATFTPSESEFLTLNSSAFQGSGLNNRFLFARLSELSKQLDQRFEQFLKGKLPVQSILDSPLDLLFYTVYQAGIDQPGVISLKSDIPAGAGMGSSAAVIAVLLKLFESSRNTTEASLKNAFFQKVKYCERLQHGRGSSVDAAAVTYGGMVKVQGDTVSSIAVELGQGWYRYNTGTPCCSTGETVAYVRESWASSDIWSDFTEVTKAFESSEGKAGNLLAAVKANHRLLIEIGVVPNNVANLITRIESLGGAAKVCGAGAHVGQSAGQILAYLPDCDIATLDEKLGLSLIPLEQQRNGVYCE